MGSKLKIAGADCSVFAAPTKPRLNQRDADRA